MSSLQGLVFRKNRSVGLRPRLGSVVPIGTSTVPVRTSSQPLRGVKILKSVSNEETGRNALGLPYFGHLFKLSMLGNSGVF